MKYVGLAFVAMFIPSLEAFACSIDESISPISGIVLPRYGEVPVNVPGLYFSEEDVEEFYVEDSSGDVVPQTIDGELARFDTELRSGETYKVVRRTDDREITEFSAVDEKQLPTFFGTLVVGDQTVTPLDDNDCSSLTPPVSVAYRYVIVENPGYEHWKNVMEFETLIDDGETARHLGQPLIVRAICAGEPEVFAYPEGRHTIQVRGRLPGTDVAFESNVVPFELDCEPSSSGCSTSNIASGNTWPIAMILLGLVLRRRD